MHQQHIELPASATRLHLSEMPYQMPDEVIAALTDELSRAQLYPEPGSPAAAAALAGHWSVPAESVVLTNGCDEAILYAFLKLARGGKALIARNAYTGYKELADLAGLAAVEVPTANWAIDVEAFAAAMDGNTTVAVIANPHNPTGSILPHGEVARFIDLCTARNVIPIVDEAYLDFAMGARSLVESIGRYPNLLVLKSFAKSHGLAGIRLGAAVGTPSLIGVLRNAAACNPFSVNRLAQRVVLELAGSADRFARRRDEVVRTRDYVEAQLETAGIWFNKSFANFVFMKAPASITAMEFLAQTGFLVRDCATYGLPGYWRVSCASQGRMEMFVSHLLGLARPVIAGDRYAPA